MKKMIIILGVATFMLASCKKDYTCECTSSVTGFTATTTSTTLTGKKKDVKATCENGNSSTSAGGITTSVSCEIK